MIKGPSPELLTFLILLFSALDIWSTVRGLRAGGSEANPLGRTFFSRLGGVVVGGLVLKAIGLPIILYVIWALPQYWWAPVVILFIWAGLLLRNFTVD